MATAFRILNSVGIALRKLVVATAGTELAVDTSPSLSSGTGAASASENNGSIWMRTNGIPEYRTGDAWKAFYLAGQSSNFFLSTEQTGNGSAQNVAHGLGATPALVFVVPSDITGGAFTVAYGTHTSTNAVVTVTTGEKYRVVAFK